MVKNVKIPIPFVPERPHKTLLFDYLEKLKNDQNNDFNA